MGDEDQKPPAPERKLHPALTNLSSSIRIVETVSPWFLRYEPDHQKYIQRRHVSETRNGQKLLSVESEQALPKCFGLAARLDPGKPPLGRVSGNFAAGVWRQSGHGHRSAGQRSSESAGLPGSVTGMAAHCRGQLLNLGLSPSYFLLTMSLSAIVAVAWAKDHPEKFGGCVLINTSLRPWSPFYHRLRPQNYLPLLRLLRGNEDAVHREKPSYS